MPPIIEAAHIGETLGYERLSVDPEKGVLRARYAGRQAFSNGRDIVQGGMQAAMLDNVMALTAMAHLGEGFHITTLEMKISHLSPAPLGNLIAEGRIIKRGRKIMFMEATLFDEEENVLAIATTTARIVAIKPES